MDETNYKLIKEIPSNTQVKAWHIKVENENYQVVSAPYPRLFTVTSVYSATKNGKIKDAAKPLFTIKGDKLEDAANELINFLKGTPFLEYYIIPNVYKPE